MSECPHLTGELVASYVNGLQNSTDDTAKEGPLLTVACCKHYAIYNVETIPSIRTEFNAVVGSRDLWETYLPVFEACVGEGHGQSVMVSKKPQHPYAVHILSPAHPPFVLRRQSPAFF